MEFDCFETFLSAGNIFMALSSCCVATLDAFVWARLIVYAYVTNCYILRLFRCCV